MEGIPRFWQSDTRANIAPGVAAYPTLYRIEKAGTCSAGGSVTTAALPGSAGWAAAWIDLHPN